MPEAVAWHYGSAALGRWHPETVRRIARNQCYLVAMYYPKRYAWSILIGQALWGLVAARHGAGRAWLRGKVEGLRGSPHLQKQCEISDAMALGSWLGRNEELIGEVQRATTWDWYWRMYFLLTRGGTK